jgi:hypothetical protein
MLKELYLEFEDGRKERNIIHLNPGEQVKIYPQRDKIVVSNCKTFKYQVEKHPKNIPGNLNHQEINVVKENKLKCDCMGSGDQKIENKHIKEVEQELNKKNVKIGKTKYRTIKKLGKN